MKKKRGAAGGADEADGYKRSRTEQPLATESVALALDAGETDHFSLRSTLGLAAVPERGLPRAAAGERWRRDGHGEGDLQPLGLRGPLRSRPPGAELPREHGGPGQLRAGRAEAELGGPRWTGSRNPPRSVAGVPQRTVRRDDDEPQPLRFREPPRGQPRDAGRPREQEGREGARAARAGTGLCGAHRVVDQRARLAGPLFTSLPELPEEVAAEAIEELEKRRGSGGPPEGGRDEGGERKRARMSPASAGLEMERYGGVHGSVARHGAMTARKRKRGGPGGPQVKRHAVAREDVRQSSRGPRLDLRDDDQRDQRDEGQLVPLADTPREDELDRTIADRGRRRAGEVRAGVAGQRPFGRRYTGVNSDPVDAADARGHKLRITGSVIWCCVCGNHAARRLGKALKTDCPGGASTANQTRLSRLKQGLHPLTSRPLL